tara:strand:+ start:5088 stop:5468 length:381 start_codon:yes stop_codon:yes gene_type:complete
MILTDEQINKAVSRKEAFSFTDKQIERLWLDASMQKNIELLNIKAAEHTLILDAMFAKAFKLDKAKAFKILDIKKYLQSTLHIQKINNLQAELIDNLNLQLFEQARRYRDMEVEIQTLKTSIDERD